MAPLTSKNGKTLEVGQTVEIWRDGNCYGRYGVIDEIRPRKRKIAVKVSLLTNRIILKPEEVTIYDRPSD